MLDIYSDLFKQLNIENIFYCSWKSNHNLEGFLNGNGDLDLYVSYRDKNKFELELSRLGFKVVESYVASYPYVQHYIGLDTKTCKLVHLHVYFKIVTGESNSKNYIFPLDKWLKRNISGTREIPTLSDEAQLVVYLLRFFIKIGSPLSILLFFRDITKYKEELNSINAKEVVDLPDFISNDCFSELYESFENDSFFGKLKTSWKLKRALSGLKRKNTFAHLFYKQKNLVKRVVNKLFLKQKKNLKTGSLIAICGLDGSGKSTAVDSLVDFYSQQFTTHIIHIGRPNPTLLTFPFWMVTRIAERFKHSKKSESKSVKEFIPSTNVGIISAFRYFILSYERYQTAKHALKLVMKGHVVIADRYPTMSYGKMDSPRILHKEKMGRLYSYFHNKEKKLYQSILPCDLALHLFVPVEVAIERNRKRIKLGKETDNEIRARYLINSDLLFKSDNYCKIDATENIEKVRVSLIKTSWNHL
ncbi:hypothetical protein [Vibrio breoganii]|uniref:hypothetical protein n=1 Tax=Vibrio breoganii TaxID=553239 RepID=UPI000C83931C|nr:hypothetical protein [Vibrio breoganii]PMK30200.1 hypothetical protein BCU03_10740 [Vibrio breoganii]